MPYERYIDNSGYLVGTRAECVLRHSERTVYFGSLRVILFVPITI